jgi:hypothetical protein
LAEAFEVLNIPPVEAMLWNATIGQRYLMTQVGYPPVAARYAVDNRLYTAPTDAVFEKAMFETAYQRYLMPVEAKDTAVLQQCGLAELAAAVPFKYDFGAMDLVQPLEGLHCAPTQVFITGDPAGTLHCVAIAVAGVAITPADPAWGLAKIYALQGAAYHMLFVVHPALHFPMDSVNAITKTVVPYTHPLFQLLYPHTSYTLALDNAVLESEQSVVNDNAQGTWFDPLTGNAYNLKLLFAAGYTGLSEPRYGKAYPEYDYMQPPLLQQPGSVHKPVYDTPYSRWQTAYFERAFLPFCRSVASAILQADAADSYVRQWARHLHTCVLGFPDEKQIFEPDCLAKAMAIYLWDVSLGHGADHYSFGLNVSVVDKFLRIRRPPPATRADPPVQAGQIFTGDDLYRSAMANCMFFAPSTIAPNLDQIAYAFTDSALSDAQGLFHANLTAVSKDTSLRQFMPLKVVSPTGPSDPGVPLEVTLPASIQY